MENTPDLPAYDDAARLLHEAGVTTGAAEAHGIITGVLCAPQGARVAWGELVLGRAAAQPPPALSQLLAALYRSTHAHLSGMECDFAPLLPGDEHSLAEQIEGLSDWCRGYLLGLHAGGVKEGQDLAGDAGEIVRDITRISEAELDTALADEEEARALVEIVEYLRVGVQLVFEELQPPTAKH
ncbi:MAG: UPF0149 family protein [Gammaproteobacteria bacterium]|nr:UPF0149 family protein [Gammaproteobacteria bacterium]